MEGHQRVSDPAGTTSGERLESWKEIAAYFKRGVRTVRRWEKDEGLPVHRQVHRKLATVYAHVSELEAWRQTRRPGARATPARLEPRPSSRIVVAVLPFMTLDGAIDQEYLADGLTEEMISRIGRINPQRLAVIARTTVMHYKGASRTIRQIGAELNVHYILEGSVRHEADRVRATARLIQVRDQSHVWSRSYERPARRMLSLQRELAEDIAREVQGSLGPSQRASAGEMGSVNPEAYHAHLKGRQLLQAFTPESVRRSLELFRLAIRLDPTYAASYASLAEAYERLPMWVDEPPGNALPLALEAAEHALRLDPDLPEAYASLALIHASYLWDWSTAEKHFRRALDLNPSCVPARLWYGEFLAEMGRIEDALETTEQAMIYDPLSRAIQAQRAFAFLMGRRFDEAIAQVERVLVLAPDYPMALIRTQDELSRLAPVRFGGLV